MSGWGCPHEVRGTCARVLGRDCDPGMKGCVLAGRFEFATPAKNRPPSKPPIEAPSRSSPAAGPNGDRPRGGCDGEGGA